MKLAKKGRERMRCSFMGARALDSSTHVKGVARSRTPTRGGDAVTCDASGAVLAGSGGLHPRAGLRSVAAPAG